jgi:hypothetical protein
MTGKCCRDLEHVRQIARIIPQPSRSSRKEIKTKSGKSKHVACFGSVAIEVTSDKIKIENISSFGKASQQFQQVASFSPLCQRS